jgi:hypothetical protein
VTPEAIMPVLGSGPAILLRGPEAAPALPAVARPAPAALVPAATRRLLVGWLGLALASLVLAGLFAMLAAFARTPAIQILPTAELFHLSLTSHVTFAFTVWFVTFAGALWIYAAWRANYRLSWWASWTALWLAVAGSAGLAVPALSASGKPYLNDYLPIIDHPFFWAGLVLLGAGMSLQAGAYLAASLPVLLRRGGARAADDSPEALAMAVGAAATVIATAAFGIALLRLDPSVPFGYRLRAFAWGGGHILQFLHVAGMAAAWFVSIALSVAVVLPARRVLRALLWALLPFMVAAGAAYVVERPETLLINRWITLLTFGGLGAAAVPVLLMAAVAAFTAKRPLPWSSPLFSAMTVSFALFAIGGIMGLIGFTQDTRVPAHYHGMVGAVTLAYMGLTPLLLEICGRQPWRQRWTRWQPWLYGVGLLGIMAGMHWAGGHGAPRKTFGFTWANAQALIGLNLMGLGSALAIAGGLAFVINMGLPLLRRRETAP